MDKHQFQPPEKGLEGLRFKISEFEESRHQEKVFLGMTSLVLGSLLLVVWNFPMFGFWSHQFRRELAADRVNFLNEPKEALIVENASVHEVSSSGPKLRLYWVVRSSEE